MAASQRSSVVQGLSSRVQGLKFMQRAAAVTAAGPSSADPPSSSSPSPSTATHGVGSNASPGVRDPKLAPSAAAATHPRGTTAAASSGIERGQGAASATATATATIARSNGATTRNGIHPPESADDGNDEHWYLPVAAPETAGAMRRGARGAAAQASARDGDVEYERGWNAWLASSSSGGAADGVPDGAGTRSSIRAAPHADESEGIGQASAAARRVTAKATAAGAGAGGAGAGRRLFGEWAESARSARQRADGDDDVEDERGEAHVVEDGGDEWGGERVAAASGKVRADARGSTATRVSSAEPGAHSASKAATPASRMVRAFLKPQSQGVAQPRRDEVAAAGGYEARGSLRKASKKAKRARADEGAAADATRNHEEPPTTTKKTTEGDGRGKTASDEAAFGRQQAARSEARKRKRADMASEDKAARRRRDGFAVPSRRGAASGVPDGALVDDDDETDSGDDDDDDEEWDARDFEVEGM